MLIYVIIFLVDTIVRTLQQSARYDKSFFIYILRAILQVMRDKRLHYTYIAGIDVWLNDGIDVR